MTQTTHRQSIDLARFVAAFGVVVAHALATPRDWVGHLSLSVFLILTAFLAVQSAQRSGGRYPFVARAKRLVLPWLVWSAFFRVLDLVFSHDPDKFRLLHDPWSLLYGSAIHLWFLPFVMLAMVLVEPTVRLITTPRRVGYALGVVLVLAVPLFWAHGKLAMPEPLPQWAVSLPTYGIGLLLGVAVPMGVAVNRWVKGAGAALSLLAWAVSGSQPWVITPLLSILLFVAIWDLPIRGSWLPALGQVAFGIYLAHPFFMLVCYKLFGPDVDRIFAALFTFAITWAAIWVLRLIPAFRRIT